MKMNLRTTSFSAVLLGLMTIAASAQEAAGGVHKKTLMDLFIEGGWVMYPITACSVAMIWFIVDGYIRTSAGKLYPVDHVTQLRELFKKGDYVGAYAFAKTAGSPVADVVRAGVAFTPDGKTMTEEAIISEITRIQAELKGRSSYLSVIGVCTPMIGLTGTVTGMMSAFETLGTSGVGDPSKLSGAIGEVLVATASGLFIAIPAFISYYLLANRINKGIHDITEIVTGLFRAFPYEEIEGRKVGDEEIYAAKPDWNASSNVQS
jgi:biopolymer transport protein ExbB